MDEEAYLSKQNHLKHKTDCCKPSIKKENLNLSTLSQRHSHMINELLQAKANILPTKFYENIQDKLFLNYLSSNNNMQNNKKMDIEQENERNNYNFDLRNPYVEENEIKYVKEPMPYGNPFKLILRNKSQKIIMDGEISDEAYLATLTQEKNIKKPLKSKVNAQFLKKPKTSEGFSLKFSSKSLIL